MQERLAALQGRFILTTSGHPEMLEIFGGWQNFRISRTRGISNNQQKTTSYEELIFRNF